MSLFLILSVVIMLVNFVIFKASGTRAVAGTTAKKEIAAAKEEQSNAPEACPHFVQHIFDRRLIEAGIETTLDQCDNPNCQECREIREEERQKQIEANSRKMLEMKEANAELKAKKWAERVLAEQERRESKQIEIFGKMVDWPDAVPERAHWVMINDDYPGTGWPTVAVRWTWIDSFSGKTMYYTQRYMDSRLQSAHWNERF